MTTLQQSWSAFPPETAKIYLDGFGTPSPRSKELMASVLKDLFGDKPFRLADFGCGNAHLAAYFLDLGLNMHYIGYDFSSPLLVAGQERFAKHERISLQEADIEDIGTMLPEADIVLYSHVLEILQSPQKSLIVAKRCAPLIMIRFFEPPVGEFDIVEIKSMNTGGAESPPYIRRTMSRGYYNLLLHQVGCAAVDVHVVDGDRDQVHVLKMSR